MPSPSRSTGGISRAAIAAHRLALRAARLRPRRRRERTPPAKRPRVAILLMSSDGVSGVVRSAFTLAEYLKTHCDVQIVSVIRRSRRPRFFAAPEGVRMTTLDNQVGRPPRRRMIALARRLLRRPRGRLVHPADPRAGETTWWTDLMLLRHLGRLQADIVIGTRWSLSILAAHLTPEGTTVIGQEHQNLAMKSRAKVDAIRDGYGALDVVVALTESDRAAYDELLGGRTRAVRIPNAVPRLPGPASTVSDPVILGAGRLTRQKGFDRLVSAFAEVAPQAPDWTLRICGKGPVMTKLERLTAEHGLEDRVQLPGRIDDVAGEMERASIFALSSRFEGFPMVLLEAMGKGLPVVAFECPTGPADMVADGSSGVLVPDGDVGSFAQALLDLIGDETKRRRYGSAATARAGAFSVPEVGRLWDDLIAELLADPAKR